MYGVIHFVEEYSFKIVIRLFLVFTVTHQHRFHLNEDEILVIKSNLVFNFTKWVTRCTVTQNNETR